MWPGEAHLGDYVLSRRYLALFHSLRHPAAMLLPRRGKVVSARRRGEEQLFQVGPVQTFQLSPLFNWQEHSSFDAAPCHDLWSLFERRLQQLAEPRLCFLNRPFPVNSSPLLQSF